MRIALTLLMLIAFASLAQSEPSTGVDDNDDNGGKPQRVADQEGSHTNPQGDFAQAPNRPKAEVEAGKGHNHRQNDSLPPWGRPIEIAEVVVIGATGIILLWQVCLFRRQTRASIVTAQTARKQTLLTKQELHRSHRPWIGFEGDIEIISGLDFDSQPILEIEASLRNAGNSPALEVVWRPFLRIEPGGPPATREMGISPADVRKHHTHVFKDGDGVLILPGETLKVPHKIIDPSVMHMQDNVTVWLNGYIGYRDEFGKRHATTFAFAFLKEDGGREITPEGKTVGHFERAAAGWRDIQYGEEEQSE